MSKEEKGFFDGLVEDFAASLEMKAAIEDSRDENGKVDKWKATGLAMGLGHTSDDDIAMMGALLGAEGAFDDEEDTNFDSFDDFGDDVIPNAPVPHYTAPNTQTVKPMTEWDYESKKAEILAEKKYIIVIAVVGLFLFTAPFLYMIGSQPNYTGVYLLLMGVLDISFLIAILNTTQARERELTTLENQYRESKRIEEEKKKAQQAHDELKNYAGTQDIATIVHLITQKMKHLYDSADQVCDVTEPSFYPDFVPSLLSGLIYLAAKNCDLTTTAKDSLYDFTLSKAGIESACTGEMLFPECPAELDTMLKKLVNEIFTGVTVAAHKSGNPRGDMDLTKTVCSLMIILSDIIKHDTSYAGFEKAAVSVTLKEAEKAAQRVIDERLLD